MLSVVGHQWRFDPAPVECMTGHFTASSMALSSSRGAHRMRLLPAFVQSIVAIVLIDFAYEPPRPRVPRGARRNAPFRPRGRALPRVAADAVGAASKARGFPRRLPRRAPARPARADGRGRRGRRPRATHPPRRRGHPEPRAREPGPALRAAEGRAHPDARALPPAARGAPDHEDAAEAV